MLVFEKKGVPLQYLSCACGGIGRHARLRIWCSDACRFESYQAYKRRKEFHWNSFLLFIYYTRYWVLTRFYYFSYVRSSLWSITEGFSCSRV